MDISVPECSALGATGASIPLALVSAVEVAEACAAQVREPAPDRGRPPWPLRGPLLVALPLSRVPLTDSAVGSCGKGRELHTGDPCEARVAVLASRREQGSQTALVWGAPGRAELGLHLRAGEGICLHHLPSLRRAGFLRKPRQAGGRSYRSLWWVTCTPTLGAV